MNYTPGFGSLPRIFDGSTPRLRTLDLVGYAPWPANRFRDLSSLALGLVEIERLDRISLMLEDSPRLEHLYLWWCQFRTQDRSFTTSLKHPVDAHYLKTLYLS